MKQKTTNCGYCQCCYNAEALPPCLEKPKKLNPQPLYYERWCEERRKADSRFMEAADMRTCKQMETFSAVKGRWRNKYMEMWNGLNPMPNITRDEFIHQLHGRVSALEAALAEKGGLR